MREGKWEGGASARGRFPPIPWRPEVALPDGTMARDVIRLAPLLPVPALLLLQPTPGYKL